MSETKKKKVLCYVFIIHHISQRYKLVWFCELGCASSVLPGIGSEHGKSVFLLLSKIKALPSLEAQKDMVKWVLQVGYSISQFSFYIFIIYIM